MAPFLIFVDKTKLDLDNLNRLIFFDRLSGQLVGNVFFLLKEFV